MKIFYSFISLLSQLLVLLLFNSILKLLGIPISIPIIIVAACEFEEDKVDSMEVQQALPPVPEASEPLPLAQVFQIFRLKSKLLKSTKKTSGGSWSSRSNRRKRVELS